MDNFAERESSFTCTHVRVQASAVRILYDSGALLTSRDVTSASVTSTLRVTQDVSNYGRRHRIPRNAVRRADVACSIDESQSVARQHPPAGKCRS